MEHWKLVLEKLGYGFLSEGSFEHHNQAYLTAEKKIAQELFSHSSDRPVFLGHKQHQVADLEKLYSKGREAKMAPQSASLETVLDDLMDLYHGMPDWNHPLSMPNVVGPPNLASSMAAMLANTFSPNMISGESAWGVAKSEIEAVAMLSDLIGWDSQSAGGVFTFGGSGCYLYGLKYALTQVLGQRSRHQGIRTDGKLLVSRYGHYCKINSSDWTGLGIDNVISIEGNPKDYSMDISDLEKKLELLAVKKIPVICIVCTVGSTDTFAVDDVKAIAELLQKYPNPPGFGRPILYCDAVIGWSWLAFKNYNFDLNPLGFSDAVLPIIQHNYNKIKNVVYADAIGCDFHKTGWSPYNSSVFLVKDHSTFKRLLSRPGSEYLQERTSYNPGLYTLEVSRSGAYSSTAWATLRYFGIEGFQAILGGVLERKERLRAKLDQPNDEFVCVATGAFGFVTLFRVYPKGVNGDVQYIKERDYPDCQPALAKHNRLQERIAETLWEWFRSGKKIQIQIDGELVESYAPYITYTKGFRKTSYNLNDSESGVMIYALKAYPMNINIKEFSYDILLGFLRRARDEVIAEGWLD